MKIIEDNNQMLTIQHEDESVSTVLKHEFLTELTGRMHERSSEVWVNNDKPVKVNEPAIKQRRSIPDLIKEVFSKIG